MPAFALGLDAGTPIKEAALAGGVEGLYAGLPVIFLVTLGGFLTNAVYCLQQNIANKTMGDYAKRNVWGNNLSFLCFGWSIMVYAILRFGNG